MNGGSQGAREITGITKSTRESRETHTTALHLSAAAHVARSEFDDTALSENGWPVMPVFPWNL